MKKITTSGITWTLLGLIFILIKIGPPGVALGKWVLDLIAHLGIAFIVLGAVAIILDFKSWRDYYNERLKDIVMEQSYLNNLSDEELDKLQIKTLKAKYKEHDIDREGSFLYYFQKKIQKYIGGPYREDFSVVIKVEDYMPKKNCYKMIQKIFYNCRSLGKNIQNDVRWGFDYGEIIDLIDLYFLIKCPKNDVLTCKGKCELIELCDNRKLLLTKEDLVRDYEEKSGKETNYVFPLDKIWPKDKIRVEITSIYNFNADYFWSWLMMFPTKGINIHIDFPTGFKLQTYIIGIEPDEYEPKEFESTFFFSHSDWFLPLTGFAFMLKKETVNEGLPVSGKILPDTSSEMITTENT